MSHTHALTDPITLEAFEAFIALPENRDRRFELIHGEIVEIMPTHLHQLLSKTLFLALVSFAEPRGLGEVLYEVRVRASADDIHNDRIPDISFTVTARLLPVVRQGAVPQIPDLCVEIQSPGDSPTAMRAKAAYYLANGAQQVWLLFTQKPLIEVAHADGQTDFYLPGDTLTGGDLLPGFAIAVDDIYRVRDGDA